MKKVAWILSVAGILAFSACDQPEHRAGTGDIRGPYIVESVLAASLSDNGFPEGITDVFNRGDEVYLWILWDNFDDFHKINVVWLQPSGATYAEDSVIVDGDGLKVTYFMVRLSELVQSGEWGVQIYLDDVFRRSLFFYVSQP